MTNLDRVVHEPARLMLVALLAGVEEAGTRCVRVVVGTRMPGRPIRAPR
ncbi:MAG TPA: hypothetical protein VMM93_01910 [Vicinamibacterales bacterium]|nr:hypothetical protein [Vicinamibacterales bacterium]